MNSFIEKLQRIFEPLYSKMKKILENVWFKRVATLLLILYSANYLYNQYENLNLTFSTLSINYTLLVFSSLIIIVTIISSVYVWNKIIISMGFSFPWLEIAKTQMLSSVGKYIPGHIWNYTSKIYLSHKLGLPIKLAGVAVFIEIIITYVLAFCLLLIFIPGSIFPEININVMILFRIFGALIILGTFSAPYYLKIFFNRFNLIKNSRQLFFAILIRAGIWIISSYAFSLLVESLGLAQIGLFTAVAIITSSFFIGFLAIFTPDGLVIREAIIIFLLRKILSQPDATILSLIFRFQLIVLEFIVILMVLVIWKIWKNHSNIISNLGDGSLNK